MKTFMKALFLLLLVNFIWGNGYAQTAAKKPATTQKSKSKSTAKKHTVSYGKEIPVTLKNLAEGTIPIFAGPKEDLKTDKMKRKTVGGLSTNKLYLRVNEVVCILNRDKTVSCAAIKSNTTNLEINISGNEIVAK